MKNDAWNIELWTSIGKWNRGKIRLKPAKLLWCNSTELQLPNITEYLLHSCISCLLNGKMFLLFVILFVC